MNLIGGLFFSILPSEPPKVASVELFLGHSVYGERSTELRAQRGAYRRSREVGEVN